ncbi:MAG: deoxyribonuclease IV [Fusobacteria bacterium]|nr:MAG: deoxyribonuclease IV [Fusobacteriota bacterium]KAF0228086.1 MAG: deoxyribonuclease [Fusobacteriota bacterium]
MFNIGCHMSVSKGYKYMGSRILELGGNTFQYFSRNPRGGSVKAIDKADAQALSELMIANSFAPILTHAPYTMNMAAAKDDTYDFAKRVFREDLERLEELPSTLYNFHPGSHTGMGIDWGLERIIKGLNEVVFKESTSTILFEVMAGKGSEIGSNFEEIKILLDNVNFRDKFGVCLDTCHLYESGYDIVNDLDGVLDEMEKSFNLDKIKAIHLNDSKNSLGARKDRHEKLGEGSLGIGTIMNIVTNPRLKDKPFFLETPNEEEGYAREIKMIKEMLENESN